MAINQRGILGPANPVDNGSRANYVNGDEPMVARDDQASDRVNESLTAAYKSSYARHSTGAQDGNGSAGIRLGASDVDYGFSTSGYNGSDTGSDKSGEGKGIAGSLPLSTRADGADSVSDGTGNAIG